MLVRNKPVKALGVWLYPGHPHILEEFERGRRKDILQLRVLGKEEPLEAIFKTLSQMEPVMGALGWKL